MKQTPMMKLIELLDKAQQPELQVLKERDKYHARDVRQAELINKAVNFCIAKATELMQEEREAITEAYYEGSEQCHLTQMASHYASTYYTQKYGGGDE